MTRETIVDQYSYRGDPGAIWSGFDIVLDTDAYLNLGYSGRFQSHLIGSPQHRLAELVASQLEELGVGSGDRVLDIGCGRGGPARLFHSRLGAHCLGVDIVPHNVELAAAVADEGPEPPAFAIADATALPIGAGRIDAATAIDAIVYVDDLAGVLGEIDRTLHPGGVAVITDLLVDDGADPEAPALVRFAETWGFPPLRTVAGYEAALDAASLTVTRAVDLSGNSVRRFRSWTTRYRCLRRAPTGRVIGALADRVDLDIEAIDRFVDTAHAALPQLRHELFVVEKPP